MTEGHSLPAANPRAEPPPWFSSPGRQPGEPPAEGPDGEHPVREPDPEDSATLPVVDEDGDLVIDAGDEAADSTQPGRDRLD